MECKQLQEKFENMIFTGELKLTPEEQSHFDHCETCRNNHALAVKAAERMKHIRNMEPVLTKPDELTVRIMNSLPEERKKPPVHSYRIFIRLLTAAVVALLVTLGVEQYAVVTKVQQLEINLGKANHKSVRDNTLVQEASLINSGELLESLKNGFSISELPEIIKYKRLMQLDFTFYDMKRFLKKQTLFNISKDNKTR